MTVGDTLGNAHALVDTLVITVPEMEEKSLGDTQGGAQALLDTRADKVAVGIGDTWLHTGRFARTGRHAN